MRFFLVLKLVVFIGCSNSIHAAEPVNLSFSVYLEINGEFIYPVGQSAESPDSKPFEMVLDVRALPDHSLQSIVLIHCMKNLGIAAIESIQAEMISFFPGGIMVTHVESCTSSTVTSPAGSEKLCSFSEIIDLLTLNNSDLIEQIHGKSLRVSIQSSTDCIYSVGLRLRQRELRNL